MKAEKEVLDRTLTEKNKTLTALTAIKVLLSVDQFIYYPMPDTDEYMSRSFRTHDLHRVCRTRLQLEMLPATPFYLGLF